MMNAPLKLSKKPIVAAFFLLITTALLVACGDTPTNAPAAAPASTTAAAANGSATTAATGANGTAAAGANPANGAPGNGANRGQFNAVTGTVVSYDPTAKSLTVKAADGTSQTFDATNANISKNQKITVADLGKLTLAGEIVQVTGEKAADGTYSATALVLADQNMFGGNGAFPGANGTPGAGRGNGAAPGANGTPGTGRGNGANGTPGAGFGGGGFGGPNGAANGNRLMVRNAAISGNTLTGTDMTGAAVTVNLTDATQITHRTADTATDLTAGQKISVNFRAAQNNAASPAVAITIEQ